MSTPKQVYIFPVPEVQDKHRQDLKAEIRVLNDNIWLRMCTGVGDLGFAESYMFGDVACDDLVPLLEVMIFS